MDPVKVAAAGMLGRMFSRGLGNGGALSRGLGSKLMQPAATLNRATPLSGSTQRLIGNPNFQEVMSASQSGFPKLPGLNLGSPSTMQGILRPGQMRNLGASGAAGTMQKNLMAARPAMARTIRGFRGLQQQGVM